MNRKKILSPQGEVAAILVEFLEVAINSVIFLKGFYPTGAFERRRYMNVVVHKAIHPELSDYIHSSTYGLGKFIEKGLVERVILLFYDEQHVPLEKFVFKIGVNQSYNSKIEENNLEFALRAFLIKLTVAKPLIKPLPPGCNWEITAYFRALPQGNTQETQLWIPSDMKQWLHPPDITPIKSMSSEPLKLQFYVEHPYHSEPKNATI